MRTKSVPLGQRSNNISALRTHREICASLGPGVNVELQASNVSINAYSFPNSSTLQLAHPNTNRMQSKCASQSPKKPSAKSVKSIKGSLAEQGRKILEKTSDMLFQTTQIKKHPLFQTHFNLPINQTLHQTVSHAVSPPTQTIRKITKLSYGCDFDHLQIVASSLALQSLPSSNLT